MKNNKISVEHEEQLNRLIVIPEVWQEIKRRVQNGTTFTCAHGNKVPLKSECEKCDNDIREVTHLRQQAALASGAVRHWLKRAADLGDGRAKEQLEKLSKVKPECTPSTS